MFVVGNANKLDLRVLSYAELEAEFKRVLDLLLKHCRDKEVTVDIMPYLVLRQVHRIISRLEDCGYMVEVDCFPLRSSEATPRWKFTSDGSVRLFVTQVQDHEVFPGFDVSQSQPEPPIRALTPAEVEEFLQEKQWSEHQIRPHRQVPHHITKRMRQEAWWRNNAYAVSRLIRGLRSSLSVQELQDLSQPTPLDRRFTPRHLPTRALHKPKQE